MNVLTQKIISSMIPIKLVKKSFNPILLYHSLGSKEQFNKNIDHVKLDVLYNQLEYIKKYWKFVSIDEYVNSEKKDGIASITIDDGYKNIIDESLKVFKSLNIPITLLINSSTFKKKIFWRDKVRYLIKKDLVLEFQKNSQIFKKYNINDFYLITKNPKFNSIQVEKEIDQFLYKQNINLNNELKLCFDDKKYLIKDDLIFYGNHTANHYMLSSLSKQEQYDEINDCKNFIDKLNVNTTKIFGVPFGGENSFNEDTVMILKDLDYKILLKSNNSLDSKSFSTQINRFMPQNSNIKITLKYLYIKTLLKNMFR
jgi:peptidoglycan/xylan/chitin deacetylase (PgdA/CDA1 family)